MPFLRLWLDRPSTPADPVPVRALRAELVDGQSQILFDPRAPEPSPGPGDAIVRTRLAGIAPADLAIARGQPHAGILGHECVGVVESITPGGAPTPDPKSLIGKRVVIQPDLVCAMCDLCRAGLSQHCRARRTLGTGNTGGCIAERFSVPLRNLVVIPDAIDDDTAALAEPLACALHAAQIVRLAGKSYVTVLGDDAHALLMAQVMARLNASVRVLGDRPERFGIAEKWGVKHRHVSEVGRRADQDVVICSTPDAAMLDMAMGLIRPRGKIVLRGGASPHAHAWERLDLSPILDAELELLGARGGRLSDAIAALEQKQFDVVSLITKRFKLDEAMAAMRAASEPDALKILIEC